eukprot:4853552-Pyramimonas_sp.AAC.1
MALQLPAPRNPSIVDDQPCRPARAAWEAPWLKYLRCDPDSKVRLAEVRNPLTCCFPCAGIGGPERAIKEA